jgi:hypothetical protein
MNSELTDMPGVRRSRSRLDALVQVSIDGLSWQGLVLDVSLSGMRLERPAGVDLRAGQSLEVTVEAGGGQVPPIAAHVVRIASSEIALEFDGPEPAAEQALAAMMETFGELLAGPPV